MKRLIITSIFCTIIIGALAQEKKQTIHKEYELSGASKVLRVSNVNGFVKVEGYDGDKVTMDIAEHLKAKTQSSLEELISKVGVADEEYGDTLEIYVNTPCSCDCNNGSRYNWNNCRVRGNYTYDFTIKVPRGLNLDLSTVNKGNISVSNVNGVVKANNINGAIYLKGITEAVDVHSINGDVEIDYTALPKRDSEYYTLNGDLTILYPESLSADMSFKSFNGDFYTNFTITERMGSLARKTESGERGTTYKISESTLVRVGSGGVRLTFETFNGDIFIKKNQ